MSDYSGTENLEVMADAVKYNQFLVSLIQREIKPGALVVDFGAGIGTFAQKVAVAGNQVHCIEPDHRQLERIVALGLPASRNINDFEDASIDILYTLNVLEHIENDVEVLADCYQKIKPGGHILIYVPAFKVLYSSMDKKVGHLRRYTRSTLAEKVGMAGFAVVRNEYVDSVGFFASLVFKVFGNDSGTINRGALIVYDRYIFPLSRLADFVCSKVFGKNVYLIARRP
jgi:predicted SAM-dependent methyltransferase